MRRRRDIHGNADAAGLSRVAAAAPVAIDREKAAKHASARGEVPSSLSIKYLSSPAEREARGEGDPGAYTVPEFENGTGASFEEHAWSGHLGPLPLAVLGRG